jgi:hypothetical protein
MGKGEMGNGVRRRDVAAGDGGSGGVRLSWVVVGDCLVVIWWWVGRRGGWTA